MFLYERVIYMNFFKEGLSWDEYYIALAAISALRSKDPKCKVGACIINPTNHRVLSLGYNGFPINCPDDEFPWTKDDPDVDKNKFGYVVHAELNAILNANADITGSWLYTTHYPCNECAKAIIQSGITKVIYYNDYKPDSPIHRASEKMFKYANIEVVDIKNTIDKATLKMLSLFL